MKKLTFGIVINDTERIIDISLSLKSSSLITSFVSSTHFECDSGRN
jgi:hypothetical protein